MSQPINTFGQDEVTHLRSQNDQLWKIIEKQRVMIQNLQKDNVLLSAERDGLQNQVHALEKEIARKQQLASLMISSQSLPEIAEGDDADSTPTSETMEPVSPMPPPRSPYRTIKSDDFHSLDTLMVNQEPVYVRSNSMDDLNGRSSPIPTNNNYRKEKNSYVPLTPSKSSSSLETRKNIIRQSTLRDQEPSIRSVSPTLYQSAPSLHRQKTDEDSFLLGTVSNIHVKVIGSHIKPNEKGREVVSFIITVGSYREDDQFKERWCVEKLYSDFLALDSKLKSQRNKSIIHQIGKLPDKTLFSNNAPTKVDQRKVALEQYLRHVISLPLEDTSDLCEFLSTNVVDAKIQQKVPNGQKEGYLTKRGKNFGGWKTRYFVLKESVLEYYESKDGVQLGSIRLTNAQIGTQMQNASNDDSSVYRHAFLIVEQKRMGSTHSVRHILCANSDDDRDGWVHALLNHINIVEDNIYHQKPNKKKLLEKPNILKSIQPISHLKLDSVNNSHPEKLGGDSSESETASIPSGAQTWSSYDPPRASLDQKSLQGTIRRSSTSNLDQHEDQRLASPTLIEDEKKSRNKRMTFWGKKILFNSTDALHETSQTVQPHPSQSSSATTSYSENSSNTGLRGFLSRTSHEQSDRQRHKTIEEVPPLTKPPKQVFGVSLEEAVRISRVAEGYELPAIVYRCIEYLDNMNAVLEEGLYRLSGSNSMMKALCERFNQEGDVDLLASPEEYDVHVVAGLLKMWLRELPTSVLTRDHRIEFLHVIDLLDRKDRVNELGRLVSLLPLANYTLLRALTAHLIRVVQHSDINKMTMRNVSIVFSPTLGIPATIFNLFMSEFEYIFYTTEEGDAAPRKIEDEEEGSHRTAMRVKEEHGRSNRNSVNYMDGAPDAIVDLEKNMEGSRMLGEEDDVDDLSISTTGTSLHS